MIQTVVKLKYIILCLIVGLSIIVISPKLVSPRMDHGSNPTSMDSVSPQSQPLQAQGTNSASHLQASILDAKGRLYAAQGQYKKAIDSFQQSLAAAQASHSTWGEGTTTLTMNNLGAALFLAGDLAQAEQVLLEVVKRSESQRARIGPNAAHNIQFFDSQQSFIYRTLQRVLVAQDKPKAALETAERSRARVFIEQLSQRSQANVDSSVPSSLTEFPSIADIQRIAKAQNATLVEYSLVPDTAEMFSGRDKDELRNAPIQVLIWVVQPSGNIEFRSVDLRQALPEGMSLGDMVKVTRESIGVRGRSSDASQPITADLSISTQRLQQLHQILIEPIAPFLPQTPTEPVIFAPQESLLLVPYAALQDQTGRYLIQDHTILATPSLQVLDWTQQQQQKMQKVGLQELLILGNPTMPTLPTATQPLQSLPGAAQEAQEVAQFFCEEGLIGRKGVCPKAITGQQGTKATVLAQMPRSRIIHLATHGVLDIVSDTGVPGAIALAPAGADDGWLKADEIRNLDLNAELVVLSACDTGRGSIRADGVLGLSRAFMTAGAPNVLVSLWSIPDAPTTVLMTEFYRQFQKQGLGKAAALRQAQIAMITDNFLPNSTATRSSVDWNPGNSASAPITRKHRHPAAWAPFILIGDGL